MSKNSLRQFPRLRPIKQSVASLKQHLNTLQQLPRRVKGKAANLSELNYLIQSKLEQLNNLS